MKSFYLERHEKYEVSDCQVYLSASISGLKDQHAGNVPELVRYIIDNGGDVLDEHIRGRDLSEMVSIVKRRTGVDRLASPEPWKVVYQQDMEWVDQATHMIVFVDGPSHGVGMELMRAMLKPHMGLPVTPILLLVHEDNLAKLSPVVRGIPTDVYPVQLAMYQDWSNIIQLVDTFLLHRQ